MRRRLSPIGVVSAARERLRDGPKTRRVEGKGPDLLSSRSGLRPFVAPVLFVSVSVSVNDSEDVNVNVNVHDRWSGSGASQVLKSGNPSRRRASGVLAQPGLS